MKVRIKASGRVQGVGFRYTTVQLAQDAGIFGTVKNETDGSVTIEAVGEKTAIDHFIAALKKQPRNPFAQVQHLEINEDETIKDYTSFNVIYY